MGMDVGNRVRGLVFSLGLGALLLTLFWMAGGVPSARAAPTNRYVSVGGTDAGSCDLAASPCGTIQYAVDVSNDGDAIFVSEGHYTGVQVRNGVTQMVYLTKTVAILGGFNTAFDDRGTIGVSYPTVLDAERNGRVFYIQGTASPVIEGFRIIHGDAQAGGGTGYGGGLFAVGDPGPALTVTLRHNDVITNYAGSGGGLSFIFTNAVLKRNRIQRNEASNNGGGMRMEQTNADIWDTLVRYNHANSAGALYLSTLVNIEVTNTVVADNRASMGAAGIYGGGSSMRMIHTTVAANKGGDGTGIVAGFGFFSGPASLYMENSVVVSHAVGITVAEGTAFLTSTARLDGVLWYVNGTNIDGGGDISVTHEYTGNPRFAPDGFHILPGSYAIDRGVSTASTMDFDGQPRPFGPAPDLGVDEARIWWIYVPIVLRNS